jgi:hypothetical protein
LKRGFKSSGSLQNSLKETLHQIDPWISRLKPIVFEWGCLRQLLRRRIREVALNTIASKVSDN